MRARTGSSLLWPRPRSLDRCLRRVRLVRHRRGRPESGEAPPRARPAPRSPATSWSSSRTTRRLQNADNIIPAVNAATARARRCWRPQRGLRPRSPPRTWSNLNAAVDVERQSAEDVAAAYVEENGVTDGLEQGSGPIAVGAANFTESQVLANVYADVLNAAGFQATVQRPATASSTSPALQAAEIQAFPGVPGHGHRVHRRADDGHEPVASGDVDETVDALQPLAEEAGLVFGEPSEAADQNAFAVTRSSPTSSASPRCRSWPRPAATGR